MEHYEEGQRAGSAARGAGRWPAEALDDGAMCVRSFHVRAVREENGARSIRVVASTPTVDYYDEIVEQTWRLDRFKANPVILWAHMSRELPLGYATEIGLVDGNLEMTINFVDEKANPKAPQVFESYKQGSMKAVSVGFGPGDVRLEKRDGKDVWVLAENELIECSCTPIGANPDALAKMRARALERISAARSGPERQMDEKEKALFEAEKRAKDAVDAARAADARAKAAETERDGLRAEREGIIKSLVSALVECGRFFKDEADEQTELASNNFGLFQKLAGKRAVRGAGIVGAKGMGDDPTPPASRENSENGSVDLCAEVN